MLRPGFSREDRERNVRQIAFVANLLARNGVIVIVAAVSPYRASRDEARSTLRRFVEVHVDCSALECERRDVKGTYKRARAGELPGFTGVDAPYEAPEISLRTDRQSVGECVAQILAELKSRQYGCGDEFHHSGSIPVARRTRATG